MGSCIEKRASQTNKDTPSDWEVGMAAEIARGETDENLPQGEKMWIREESGCIYDALSSAVDLGNEGEISSDSEASRPDSARMHACSVGTLASPTKEGSEGCGSQSKQTHWVARRGPSPYPWAKGPPMSDHTPFKVSS